MSIINLVPRSRWWSPAVEMIECFEIVRRSLTLRTRMQSTGLATLFGVKGGKIKSNLCTGMYN